MNCLTELGELIRDRRNMKHMSQEELAEKCQLSPRHISDIENGKTNPKYQTLVMLCSECEIDIGDLPKRHYNISVFKEAVLA